MGRSRKGVNCFKRVAQRVKSLPAVQDAGIHSPGQEDPLEEENGNPHQHSCLKKPMDRIAWWATDKGSQRVRWTEQPSNHKTK